MDWKEKKRIILKTTKEYEEKENEKNKKIKINEGITEVE